MTKVRSYDGQCGQVKDAHSTHSRSGEHHKLALMQPTCNHKQSVSCHARRPRQVRIWDNYHPTPSELVSDFRKRDELSLSWLSLWPHSHDSMNSMTLLVSQDQDFSERLLNLKTKIYIPWELWSVDLDKYWSDMTWQRTAPDILIRRQHAEAFAQPQDTNYYIMAAQRWWWWYVIIHTYVHTFYDTNMHTYTVNTYSCTNMHLTTVCLLHCACCLLSGAQIGLWQTPKGPSQRHTDRKRN